MNENTSSKKSSIPMFLIALWLLALTALFVFMFIKASKTREAESQKTTVVKKIDIASIQPSDQISGEKIKAMDERLVQIEKRMETVSAVETRMAQIEEQTKDFGQIVSRVEALEKHVSSYSEKQPADGEIKTSAGESSQTIKAQPPAGGGSEPPKSAGTDSVESPKIKKTDESPVDETPIIRDEITLLKVYKPNSYKPNSYKPNSVAKTAQPPVSPKIKKRKQVKIIEQKTLAWNDEDITEKSLPEEVGGYQGNVSEYPYGIMRESKDINQSSSSIYNIGQRYAPSYGVDRDKERSMNKTAPAINIFPQLSIR